MSSPLKARHVAAILLVVAGVGYVAVFGTPYLEDEQHHHPQIQTILERGFTGGVKVTMIPGYHVVLAGLVYVTGLRSLDGMRMLSLIVSLGTAWVFYRTCKSTHPRGAPLRALQFFLIPILFPYFFLVYTDPLSLLFPLLSVWACVTGRYRMASLAGILGLLFRQSNVIWLAMVFVMAYVEEHGTSITAPNVRRHVARCWPFLIGFALFATFVVINRGVALGAFREFHHSAPVHTGNLFFSLLVFFALFLPLIVAKLPDIRLLLIRRPYVWLGLAGVFALYTLTFTVDHPWNVDEPWYLRNRVLDTLAHQTLPRALAFVPIGLALLTISVTRLTRPSMYALYPSWALALVPAGLIEPRYYIPIFALFILFRRPESSRLEAAIVTWFSILSLGLFVGVVAQWFTI